MKRLVQYLAMCLPAVCTCSLTTTNVAFGAYNPPAFGDADTTGAVHADCGAVAGLLIPFNSRSPPAAMPRGA